MPAPNQDVVEDVLSPFSDVIVDVFRQSWQDWIDSGFQSTWEFKRTRANFVWAQMAIRAKEVFEHYPDVRIIEENETLKFLVSDTVLFRLKKGDKSGLTANIKTQLVLAYHDHDVDLFGFPEIHRVDIVYVLNTLETDIYEILVVGRDGDRVEWTFSLLSSGEGVVELPMPSDPPSDAAPVRALVRPKATQKGADTKSRS